MKKNRWIHWLGCLLVFTGIAGAQDFVPDAVYVRFSGTRFAFSQEKGGSRYVPVKKLFDRKDFRMDDYGLKPMAYSLAYGDHPVLANTYRIGFDSVQKVEELMESLKRNPDVAYVERVPQYGICAVPEEPFWGEVEGVNVSWHLEMMGLPELYGRYAGNPAVKVAVVDNAVWSGHEDLSLASENLYRICDDTVGTADPPASVDQFQECYPPDVAGFVPAFAWSHGTHCAGLIAAVSGNGRGIASFGSGVSLMGVGCGNISNPNQMDNTMQGILWAAERGAKAFSLSYGSAYRSIIEADVFQSLADEGIVVLAASGNAGVDAPHYPASYPGVLSVGSLDSDGNISDFSNYGQVDLWTPGGYYVRGDSVSQYEQIFSTTFCINLYNPESESFAGKHYNGMVGTSMATPLAASAAALLLSYYPDLNVYQVKEILSKTSRGRCVYVPAAMERMEAEASLGVRNLQAFWDSENRQAEIRWDPPQTPGVQSYVLYEDDGVIGTLAAGRELRFSYLQADTSAWLGVKAVYENDSSLTRYCHASKNASVSNRKEREEASPWTLKVDRLSRSVSVLGGKDFDAAEVFNLQGVRLASVSGSAREIVLGDLPDGLYFLRIRKGAEVRTLKFVF